MESRSLYHLADVALSRGALPNHRVESALTSPTPSIFADSIERLPAPHLRHYPSMPHINTYFQRNAQSPPPLNRAPAPVQSRTPLASPDTRRQPTVDEPPADLIEQISAVLSRFGLGVHQLDPQQRSQASHQSPPSSSPSTLSLSECEPRRHPLLTTQTPQVSGADSVRFSLPATGQRTGASLNLPPLAATPSAITLPSQKSEWDRDDRDLLKSANRTHYNES